MRNGRTNLKVNSGSLELLNETIQSKTKKKEK